MRLPTDVPSVIASEFDEETEAEVEEVLTVAVVVLAKTNVEISAPQIVERITIALIIIFFMANLVIFPPKLKI